jgi:hypothetical protein
MEEPDLSISFSITSNQDDRGDFNINSERSELAMSLKYFQDWK